MLLSLALGLALLAPGAAPFASGTSQPDPGAERLKALAEELRRDRADPRALVLLGELRQLEDDGADLATVAALQATIAADRAAHPEVRAAARLGLAQAERARGNLARADAELLRLALVVDWLVIGPFDDEGKKGFDAVYPPEASFDPAAALPGKVRTVSWRPLPAEARRSGHADLGTVLRPAREVVAYALATVESPREQRVRLYLGASGAVKLWVNGALAIAEAAYHPARLDQAGAAVTLRKGPNRILVKLCHAEGRMRFALRIATPAGEPLRLAVRPADQPVPPAPPAAAEKAERLPSLVSLLEKRALAAKGSKGEARARLDLALALAHKRSVDDRERRPAEEAARAARLAPGWAEAQLEAARLEPDGNRQRAFLEAALQAEPGGGRALLALGRHHLQRGRAHRALPMLEQARAAGAGPGAWLALAEAWEGAGLSARADRLRAEAAATWPLHAPAVAAAARAARSLDRFDEAARLWRKALALRFDDAGSRFGLEQLLVDRGDLPGALLLLDEAIRLEPGDLAVRLRRADLLAANGRVEEAEEGFIAAGRISPEDEEVLERRGRARLRAGRTAEAVADLQASLERRPQNPQLQELLRAVEPEREHFERPYLLDAAALLAEEKGRRDRPGSQDAVVLGELRVTRVHPSGLASRYHQLVVQVLSQRGVDAFRRHSYAYAQGRQEVRIERARVVKPDGAVAEGAQEGDRSASEPWYRLWYDTRARTAAFPALAPGDVLELGVRTDDVAGENLLSDYFGDVAYLLDRHPKRRWEYLLLLPPGREIHANETPPGVTRTRRPQGGGTELRWSARDLPGLQVEVGMPGASEVMPFVHVSTYASWQQVADFWWGLVRDQLRVTTEVRETAERLARETLAARRAAGADPAGDERALVETVHAFVVTNIRYVGLEIGIHGYKPYRVDEVLSRRFGDCKDKASLTHALLGVLGIDSRLVLLRMRNLGAMPEQPASLSVFNHAILYVPRFDLWLDGTAGFHGTRELPGEDREASALVVNPGAAPRYLRVPPPAAGDNLTRSTMEIRLQADGSALSQGESHVRGAGAPGYRRAYQAENDRRAALEQAFARTFPGLEVRSVSLSDLSRLEEEVVLRFELAQPRFAERTDEGLAFAPFGAAQGYAEAYAALSSRRQDLVLGEPYQNRFRYRIHLPAGLVAVGLPPPVAADTPFGAYQISLRMEEGALLAEGEVSLRVRRVSAADYPAFRELMAGLDRALARRVLLRPAQQASAAAGRSP